MIRLIAVLARVSERLYSLVAEALTGPHFELHSIFSQNQ